MKVWNGGETSSLDEASIFAEVLNILDTNQKFPYQSKEVYEYLRQMIEDKMRVQNGKLVRVATSFGEEEITDSSVEDFLNWVNTNAYDHCAMAELQDNELFYVNFNDFTGSEYRLKNLKS